MLELENVNVGKTSALKTHRLADIIEECKRHYPRVEGFRNDCDKLTVYYFDRYSADIPLSLNEGDAKFTIEVARRILLFAGEIISKA